MTSLSGMTGFGRAAGEADWGSWTWEAKSVNGRGLDLRLNLPNGLEALEAPIKAAAKRRFARGNLQISLRIDAAAAGGLGVDEQALDALSRAWLARTGRASMNGLALAILMTARGVIETGVRDLRHIGDDDAASTALLNSGEAALENLADARRVEGRSLGDILGGLIDQMKAVRLDAKDHAERQPALLQERLTGRVADLVADISVDPDRLAAEIAMLAAKSDVLEELDRLEAHLETGQAHLRGGGPIGRKLDFLAQELGREANTLCSKSVSLDLTNSGLALKSLIDQFKEQAANVE